MIKEEYSALEIEVITFDNVDVITDSCEGDMERFGVVEG